MTTDNSRWLIADPDGILAREKARSEHYFVWLASYAYAPVIRPKPEPFEVGMGVMGKGERA